MANEQEKPDMIEPLGPAYEALQRRLLDDGAAWRAGLPSTERLEQRLKTLARQEQQGRPAAAEPRKRSSRLRVVKRAKGDSPMFQGRIKAITAAAAIAAVVVLFVVLFQHFGGHSPTGTGGPQKTPTAAAFSSPSPTPMPDQSYLLPVIAPGNPQVVYRIALASGSATQLVFQASADGGATWHSFPLPAQNSSAEEPSVLVSPLDARTVFVSLGGTLENNTCVPKQSVSGNSTLSGGGYDCVLQYLSQDGGAHWTLLQLPLYDVLGSFAAPYSQASLDNIHALQAQGTRLYAALIPRTPSSSSGSRAPGPRLVTSSDGGLTWQMADHGLPLTTETLCDVVPAPTGSMLFAIVGQGCPGAATPVSLWRSDDAGAHWSQAAQLPDTFENGMAVVSNGNAALPALYVNMGRTCLPSSAHFASRPQSGGCGGAPAELRVSLDGGKTWQNAPTQGFPAPNLNPGRPLGVLSDGSVLFLVGHQFFSWKAGKAVWKHVGPTISDGFKYALLTADSAGHDALWVVMSKGSSAYTLKKYPL